MNKQSLQIYIKKPVNEPVSIIGIPFEEGSSSMGLKDAPKYLREKGIVNLLRRAGLKVSDMGDVKWKRLKGKDINILKQNAINMAKSVASEVSSAINLGQKVLAIGGDHSISLGTISGASMRAGSDLALIWIDAHPDVNTWESSISKNIHGIQGAALMGFGDRELVNVGKTGTKIKKQNILYIGLKDMDPYEIDFLSKNNFNVITVFDVLKNEMGFVLSEIEKFTKKHKKIWVSLDMDSIQKQFVPSSPMATCDGLSAREVLAMARCIGRTHKIIGADIVEFGKKGDTDEATADLAIDLAAKLFGTDCSWYDRYMDEESK